MEAKQITDKAGHLIRYYGKVKFAQMLGTDVRTLAKRIKQGDWNIHQAAIIHSEAKNLSNIFKL